MRDGFVKVAVAAPKVRVADCEYNGKQRITVHFCEKASHKAG